MPLRPGNVMVGAPTAYDLWLVLVDMRSGRIVSRSEAPMRVAGVDPTPTPFFRESPVWVREDPVQRGYWETCRGVVGDAVDPRYLEGLFASALVADGIDAYEAGRPWQALAFYGRAAQLPAGDQMRVHNGLYLANWAVGRRDEAETAFARVVDLGLRQGQLAVKLVFRPGSTAFWPEETVSGPLPALAAAHRAGRRRARNLPPGHRAHEPDRLPRRERSAVLGTRAAGAGIVGAVGAAAHPPHGRGRAWARASSSSARARTTRRTRSTAGWSSRPCPAAPSRPPKASAPRRHPAERPPEPRVPHQGRRVILQAKARFRAWHRMPRCTLITPRPPLHSTPGKAWTR
jgi:hypothetical protein